MAERSAYGAMGAYINNANVPECSIREAKYEYELQKLKVEFKKAELKIKR
jgi:hypothetical protein